MALSGILHQLAGLFMMAGLGFAVSKAPSMQGADRVLTYILMHFTMPAMVLCSLSSVSGQVVRTGGVIIAVSFAVYLSLLALSGPVSRLLRIPEGKRGVWRCCTVFPNDGFMGYPVILAVLGSKALSLAVLMDIGFTAIVFTLGAHMIAADGKTGETRKTSLRSILLTPMNGALAASLILLITPLSIPRLLLTPLEYLSGATTPLSMLLMGLILGKGLTLQAFRRREIVSAAVIKLLVFPLLVWAVLSRIPFEEPLILPVVLLTVAMPSAATPNILAEQYQADSNMSAQIVFLSSLFCVLTIPLMALLVC